MKVARVSMVQNNAVFGCGGVNKWTGGGGNVGTVRLPEKFVSSRDVATHYDNLNAKDYLIYPLNIIFIEVSSSVAVKHCRQYKNYNKAIVLCGKQATQLRKLMSNS